MATYFDIRPAMGSIEIGYIWFAPFLQRTPQATEALFLMLRHALDELKYRRMQWRCNALNEKSRAAALRLGFTFEGIFYQHMVVKGRNRDTAWYSILDHEWPRIRGNFERWLAPENFDERGRQIASLRRLNCGSARPLDAPGRFGAT
jgi:RimJ/RimL family protein N-acetyltransferase